MSAAERKPDADDLYVSSNAKAGPVTRYSVPARSGQSVFIGAMRSNSNPKVIDYDEQLVTLIPGDEVRKYLSEYSNALKDGALVKRSREDYLAQERAQEEADKKADAERAKQREAQAKAQLEAEEKAKREAEKAAAAEQTPPTDNT